MNYFFKVLELNFRKLRTKYSTDFVMLKTYKLTRLYTVQHIQILRKLRINPNYYFRILGHV